MAVWVELRGPVGVVDAVGLASGGRGMLQSGRGYPGVGRAMKAGWDLWAWPVLGL